MLVLTAQGGFFILYLVIYVAYPKLAHRIVGYLEEEAIVSYTSYLKEIDAGVSTFLPLCFFFCCLFFLFILFCYFIILLFYYFILLIFHAED